MAGRVKKGEPAARESGQGEGALAARAPRRVGFLRRGFGALALLAVACVGLLPLAVETTWGAALVGRALSAASDQDVHVDSIEVGFWRGPVRVQGLIVGEFLRADSVVLAPDLDSLRHRRLAGFFAVEGVELHPERYEPRPPPPLSEGVSAPWALGDVTVVVHSRLPAMRGTVSHHGGSVSFDLVVDELAPAQPLDRIAGVSVHGTLTIPELLGDLRAWKGELSVSPSGDGVSVMAGLGSVVTDPRFHVSLGNGALRVDEADATVDGRRLEITHAELVADHLRVDMGVDGNFSILADFTGLPSLTELEEWREIARADDPRSLLAHLTGSASVRLGEHTFEGRSLRDLELELHASQGVIDLDRCVGMADGIAFQATGALDVSGEPAEATLQVSSPATFVVESLTGLSADGLKLTARVQGLPPWTPREKIEISGRLDILHVAIIDFDMRDVGVDFTGVGSALEFSSFETLLPGDVRATGRGKVDLADLTESLVFDLTLPSVEIPQLGEAVVEARLKVQGESYLSFDPVRITSRRADGVEQLVSGNAGLDPMADSTISFWLHSDLLQLPSIPRELLDVTASGTIDDLQAQRGRAKVRVGALSPGDEGAIARAVTDVVGAVAFDAGGARFDQVSMQVDGTRVDGQGEWILGSEGAWSMQVELHSDAYEGEGVQLQALAVTGRLSGHDRPEVVVDGGELTVTAGGGAVGEHRFERLALAAELAGKRLTLRQGSAVVAGEPIEVSGEVDLSAEGVFPAQLVARTARAQLEGATLVGLRAQMRIEDLLQVGSKEALRGTGGFEVDSAQVGESRLTGVRGDFSIGDGVLRSREVAYRYEQNAGRAAVEVDLRSSPMGVLATVTLPTLPFGAHDLRNVEVVARLAGDAVDVRSLSGTWGEFSVRGGGRFSLPVGAAGQRTASMQCTLAMEHPNLRGITMTSHLQGLAVDQAAQPRLAGDVTISVREVAVLGDVLNDFRVVASAERGVFTTSELGARWGTGELSGSGSFDASHETALYQLVVAASKIPVRSSMGRPLGFVLPIFSGQESVVTGSLDGELSVRGQGLTRADLDRHLTGGGSASVRDGRMNGSPVLGVLSGWHGLSGTTNFTAETSFRIADGKVSTARDLVVRSNQDLLTMKGSVDFDRNLDYEGKVKALGGTISPEIAPFMAILARDGFLPFRLTGTLESPSFELAPLDKMLERVILDPRTWLELFGK